METELISNEIGYSFLRPRKTKVSDVVALIIIIGIVVMVALAVIG